MNLLLHKSKFVEFHTYLDELFRAIPRLQSYSYLLSDLYVPSWATQKDHDTISGSDLYQIVNSSKVQFIWGVLSAFTQEPIIPTKLPYADGNGDIWKIGSKIQCPGADFEIVCWDSSSTLFIGVDDLLATDLKEFYPDIKCLDTYINQLA